jgi:hypothetical protein
MEDCLFDKYEGMFLSLHTQRGATFVREGNEPIL